MRAKLGNLSVAVKVLIVQLCLLQKLWLGFLYHLLQIVVWPSRLIVADCESEFCFKSSCCLDIQYFGGEIQIFSDEGKIKEHVSSLPTVKEWLKDVL